MSKLKIPKEPLMKRYPKSKVIKEALYKRRASKTKIKVCEVCNCVDYKTLANVTKRSVGVIEHLAAAVDRMEQELEATSEREKDIFLENINFRKYIAQLEKQIREGGNYAN